MRTILSILVVSAALASSAHALTVTSSDTLPSNPFSPIPTASTPVVFTDRTSSVPNLYRSPFEGTKMPNAPFTSVEGVGSATFDFTSSRTLTGLTLIWGSPDSYNKLDFYSGLGGTGSLLATVYGNDAGITPFAGPEPHNPTSAGLGYSFVKIGDLSGFQSVKFTNSPGDNAFEFSTISAVPLPASAPLFGGALIAMAGFGYFKRGKRAAASSA